MSEDNASAGEKTPMNEEQLRAALAQKPNSTRQNYQMMKLLVEQSRNEEALLYALRTIEKKSDQARVLGDILGLLQELKLPRLVQLIAMEAIKNGVTDARIYAAFARSQAAMKDWEGMSRTLDIADKANPDNKLLQRMRTKLTDRRTKRESSGAEASAE